MPALPKKTKMPDGRSEDDPPAKRFCLNADSVAFTSKTSSIFGSLQALEEKHVKHVHSSNFNDERSMWKQDPDEDEGASSGTSDLCFGRGRSTIKKSTFRQPNPPGRYRPKVPGYRAEPGKWKRYDLSSVSSDDLTEKSNTKAAFDFLDELKTRRQSSDCQDDMEDESDTHHVVFRRPKRDHIAPAACGSSVSCSSPSESVESFSCFPGTSKHVMPEYVVGAGVKKSSSVKTSSSRCTSASVPTNSVQLSHLDEGEVGDHVENVEKCEKVSFKGGKAKSKQNLRKRIVEAEDED